MEEERKIYYKILDKDMYSPYAHFKYELNKTYNTIDGEIGPYYGSFHACENMYELVLWCRFLNNIKECRFFKCYLGDTIIEDAYEVASNSIILIEEIPFKVIDEEIKNNIDKLINDKYWVIRSTVAHQGYGLETLVNDKNWRVRDMAKRKLEEKEREGK